jgi:hypothetical protein
MTESPTTDSWVMECPCCHAILTVDKATGAVIHTEPAKSTAAPESLSSALEALKAQEQARKERVRQRTEEEKHRKEILAKKVEEARKQVKDTEGPPPRPFDFD